MKYRKKPVVIDAVPVVDVVRGIESALPDWVTNAIFLGRVKRFRDAVAIETSEGIMRGDLADWLTSDLCPDLAVRPGRRVQRRDRRRQ